MDLEESRICGRLSCIQVLEFLNVTGKMRPGYVKSGKGRTLEC